MEDQKTARLHVLETSVRALVIGRDGDYQITKAKIFMVQRQDGTFCSLYPDFYQINGKIFRLLRVDRKNNTLVFQEGS